MGETTDQIEAHIEQTRENLGANLEELEQKVRSVADWRQHFRLRQFTIEPRTGGQPMVDWTATVANRASGKDQVVCGFVEIRWSHGRFGAPPEAKVHLTTPHAEVPGYFALV